MPHNLFRLVYCSRNQIRGTSSQVIDEVKKILTSARRNNAQCSVTGALLFNEGLFAQVLEGPLQSVEHTFECIQRDTRHTDITVLEFGPATRREFPNWSMAFAANSGHSRFSAFIPSFDLSRDNPSAAGEQLLLLLRDVVVQPDCLMA